ncbi:hypothetical protein HIM_00215 [Hirsutella minnesotensis 3608]|nr:hypothetical protein HIM_00215 [Hirsutella minnesotensis 3608]
MTKRPASGLDARDGHEHEDRSSKRQQRQSSTERINPEAATPLASTLAALDQSTAGIPLPSLFFVKPWTAAEISSDLPRLPKVRDPELEKVAFTHPGLGDGQSYERLEWLGDAYLELIASSLIFQTFGRTPSGRCSQLRELLIRNTTLASYFRQYGMESRARLPADIGKDRAIGRGRSCDKDPIKVQGDMFEAFVAAVIVSDPQNGLSDAVTWLRALWARTIKDQIVENERLSISARQSNVKAAYLAPGDSDLNAKDKLRATIGAKGVLIRYEDIPGNSRDKHHGLPLYTVGVYLDGWGENNKLLGTGTALKKKEAGHKAAANALENKKLVKVYEAKKKALQEATKAAEDAGEQLAS